MRKLFYYVNMTNITPLHIGNGDNTLTDLDVIKDKDGMFFIPGTSLAGCFYHLLPEADQKIFNPIGKDHLPKQSPFYISDATLNDKKIQYEVRTGIALDENKITKDGCKYDYEIVPAGHHFSFRIEVIDRDDNLTYEKIVDTILSSIENQDIRIGYKTTRGLGTFHIESVGQRSFDQSNYHEFFNFDIYDSSKYGEYELKPLESQYLNICVDLKQNGGLSIRTYQTSKGKADFVHIHSRNQPVIPGTSWNGLFRKQFQYYNDLLDCHIDIEKLFGADIDSNQKIKSQIYFQESTIHDYEIIQMTRNKINRFDASTVNGSLYMEESCYNGKTQLLMTIHQDQFTLEEINLIKKILMLIFNDLNYGFIALGGETSIGRGLFKVEGISMNNQQIHLDNWEDELC